MVEIETKLKQLDRLYLALHSMTSTWNSLEKVRFISKDPNNATKKELKRLNHEIELLSQLKEINSDIHVLEFELLDNLR